MLLLGGLAPVYGQNSQTEEEDDGISDSQSRNRFWQCNVGGGEYLVALSRISAISRHQYVLDGALVVDEVTIDTTGQSLVRFYFIEPVTSRSGGTGLGNAASKIVDRGRQVVDRGSQVTGSDVHNMVVKKFPQTTHAKQIEYRVLSKEALGALYSSAKTAWESGRGRTFRVR